MQPPDLARTREEAYRNVVGLYGIADSAAAGGDPVKLAAAMIAGGCRLVQLRCKGWSADDTRRAAMEVRSLTRRAGAAFVVNDDAHLCAEVDADGLHLGQTDGPLHLARRVVGHRWIGRSTNALGQIAPALAEGADYLAFGPMFATPNLSRPKVVQGVTRLVQARRLVPPPVRLVAIGGITADVLPDLQSAGADSWCVIGAIAGARDPVAATRELLTAR